MLDTILSNPEKVSHGREGYFFGANEEFSGREGVQAVSDALFALGRIPSPEVVKYSLDGLAKYYASILPPSFGSHGGQVRVLASASRIILLTKSCTQFVARALFSNTRCTGDRARRELGWAPAHTTKDMFEGLKSEVEILVKKIEAEKSA